MCGSSTGADCTWGITVYEYEAIKWYHVEKDEIKKETIIYLGVVSETWKMERLQIGMICNYVNGK